YEAYGTYETMRELTRELIIKAAIAVHGRPIVLRPGADGAPEAVDISGDWPVIDVHEAVSTVTGRRVQVDTGVDELADLCREQGIETRAEATAGALVLELYEHLVESRTTTPTFYRDFPVETSPLTRRKPSDPRLAERWDLVAWGSEIATAYTELTDPLDQRARLTRQAQLAAAGDPEAMQLDEDFLRALEYGMPPAGGQGMGIDRLLMLLTGRNIRDTILFPLVKPDGS
ncbi:MAG: amino acid--tRNA ligase-related protein, partial [Candidatus Nanopelagicales bacterium]|nr:amino acid--tRNA ligase-related protein [Candidatus Nanopelagicales bacterium]